MPARCAMLVSDSPSASAMMREQGQPALERLHRARLLAAAGSSSSAAIFVSLGRPAISQPCCDPRLRPRHSLDYDDVANSGP